MPSARFVGWCLIDRPNPVNVEQIEARSGSLDRHSLVAMPLGGRPAQIKLPDPAAIDFESITELGPSQRADENVSGAAWHHPVSPEVRCGTPPLWTSHLILGDRGVSKPTEIGPYDL
jgi:hypothetical protein